MKTVQYEDKTFKLRSVLRVKDMKLVRKLALAAEDEDKVNEIIAQLIAQLSVEPKFKSQDIDNLDFYLFEKLQEAVTEILQPYLDHLEEKANVEQVSPENL